MALFGPSRKQVAQRLVDGFNRRDPDLVRDAISTDCRFVDGTGSWISGREDCVEATTRFFELVDRFEIHVTVVSEQGDEVLLKGRVDTSEASLRDDKLWRARIRDGQVCEWQSYTDAEPARLARVLMGERANSSTTI